MSFAQEIRQFVVDNFLFGDDSDLKNDASFFEHGIVDSTGIMEIVTFLENNYKIDIFEEELVPDNLDSIQKIADFLEHKVRG